MSNKSHATITGPDPRLEHLLRDMLCAAMALVLLWPAARGYSQWLGWMPLWLIGMPAVAWWSLHRFRLPQAQLAVAATRNPPRRRAGFQALRRKPALPHRLPRAA